MISSRIEFKVNSLSPQESSRTMMITSVFKWTRIYAFLPLNFFLLHCCYLSFVNVNTSKQNQENSLTKISSANSVRRESQKERKNIYWTVTIFIVYLRSSNRSETENKFAYRLCTRTHMQCNMLAYVPTGQSWSVCKLSVFPPVY